ncbi:101cec95-b5d0-4a0b-a1ed-5cd7b39f2347 [Sclerotinia trifoliorum]|uniref:101cec95-b5d0-4a0b-a1ed-5cd7b39f2347 n=1 Tax=Sclerotinia trifoliorum TaxID=28548 RepID=A0A8H2VLN6_9HELO|nr:101cec95-b5d0-4a0b-a1ed-5cd7b39f2347 [Sclerotinia trifoliorum]
MGTSGLLVFVLGTQRRATYCHYDSYPTGLGQDIVDFILKLKPEQYAIMNQNLEKLEWVGRDVQVPKDLQEKYQKLGYSEPSGDERATEWYWILRKLQGAQALKPILDGELEHLVEVKLNDYIPAFSYFVDFKEMTLETRTYDKVVDKVSFQTLAELKRDYMKNLEKKLDNE